MCFILNWILYTFCTGRSCLFLLAQEEFNIKVDGGIILAFTQQDSMHGANAELGRRHPPLMTPRRPDFIYKV